MLYNLCCLSALFLTAALWLLPKSAKFVLLQYKWTVHTTTKQSYPLDFPFLKKNKQKRCAFYYWQFCVKTDLFVFSFFFNLQFVYGLKRKNEIELLSPLCCVFLYYIYIYFFFRIWLLLKIPWFWTAAVFLCCVWGPSALPSSFPDRGMSEERAEWSWHSLIPAD